MVNILFLVLLSSLTPRQEIYIIKQVLPETTTVLVLSQKPSSNDDVARFLVASTPYNISIVPVAVPSIRKASSALDNALSRNKAQCIILTNEKIFTDPMLMRFIVSKTLAAGIPIFAVNTKQVKMGAAFTFSTTEEGKIVILFNRVSLEKLHLKLPESDVFIKKEVKTK